MKMLLSLACLAALGTVEILEARAQVPAPSTSSAPALIPLPRQVAWHSGGLALNRCAVEAPANQLFLRQKAERILRASGVSPDAGSPLKIRFRIAPVAGAPGGNAEAYALQVSKSIKISAPQARGLLYGLQTLRQMLQRRGSSTWVPAARIVDWPAFGWRGFMHDVGRNPQDVATLKRFADLMARYKYNIFHLHLTDYPGYRIESRVRPELNDPQFQEQTRRPGFFYTFAQLRELIAYCGERGIEVVPKIDMPGHSKYFERAFGFPMQDPRGLEIMQEVVGEFLDEIKTPHFHMGADEVHVTNPAFINTMADFIRARGRRLLVWRPGNLPGGDTIVQR